MDENVIMPLYYIIEPTNNCNYKCIMCPNKLYKNFQKGNMEIELFRKIVKQINNNAIYIQLYWMGEPLLNKDIYEMILFIKENSKSKVIISTNGSVLNNEASNSIIKSKLDILQISLDAISSNELYSSIRCGGRT